MAIRASICASVDNVGEVEEAEAWLEQNRAKLSYASDMNGCGCCIYSWDIEGPEHIIGTLPSHLRAIAPAIAAISTQGCGSRRDRTTARDQDNEGDDSNKPASAAVGRAAIPSSTRMSAMVLVGVFYLILAVPTVLVAIGAHTPCTSNFEGGCGLAKGLAAILSLLPAAGACALGIVFATQLNAHPTIVAKAPTAAVMANLLWLAPSAYILFTLYALF